MSKALQRFVLAVTLPACAPALPPEAAAPGSEASSKERNSMTPSTEDRNEAVVRSLYENCINQDRPSLLAELIAPDYVGVRGERGPEGFGTVISALRRGIPDIHFTLHDVISDDDKVAVRWTWSGTHRGAFASYPPTGKRLQNTAIAIYRLRDGKIVQAWIETDRLGFLQALGVVDPSLGAGPGAPVERSSRPE
jgi:steroid delta-isomerase-like uncharacterized protein